MRPRRAETDSTQPPVDDTAVELDLSDPAISQMLGGTAITDNEDGSSVVDFSPDPISGAPADDPANHEANLAEFLDSSTRNAIVQKITEAVGEDVDSRSDWEGELAKGLKLLGIKTEERTFPFKGASGAVDPLMLESIVRIQAILYAELLPAGGPCKTQIVGSGSPDLTDQAERVKDWMNLYLTELAPEYYPDYRQMLFWLAFAGSTFKKVYQDPVKRRPMAPYIRADDFIVSYNTSDLFSCPRATHKSKMTLRQVRSLQLAGLWLNEKLGDPTPDSDDTALQSAIDNAAGVQNPNYEGDDEFSIYDSYLDLDLKGFEHRVEGQEVPSGLPLPYRVSLDFKNQNMFSIYRNWKQGDQSFQKKLNFVHYKLLEGPGFYGLGYAHTLGNPTSTATALIRQMIDAATLNMFPGGFRAKGMRLEENNVMIGPCQFPELDTGGVPINQAFAPLPYKELSPVTLDLRNGVRNDAKSLASNTEISTGEGRQDAPVGTTIALMEAANRPQTQMVKSAHEGMKNELKLHKELFGLYLPETPYPFPVRGGESHIMRADFSDRVDIIPVSDPNITSSSQRIMIAQAKLTLAMQAPQIHDIRQAYIQVYQSMGVTDDQINLMMPPPQQAQPMDPLTENQMVLMQKPVTAGIMQDHAAHIAVHQSLAESPVMQAHIAEHIGMKQRVDIERVLGIQLPPAGTQLPPEIENQIAVLVAQAAQKLEQERGGPEPTAGQIAMEDLKIKAQAVMQKAAQAQQKAAGDAFKVKMQYQEKEKQRGLDWAKAVLGAAANTADNQNPPLPYIKEVLRLGGVTNGGPQ
jgi:hypothetical protein